MNLTVNDLSYTYRGGHTALQNVSFTARQGELLSVLGPNGAGKTTAIRHLTGVYRPDSGSVTLEGAPIDENLAAKERICWQRSTRTPPSCMRKGKAKPTTFRC